jgi:hypothetical protein
MTIETVDASFVRQSRTHLLTVDRQAAGRRTLDWQGAAVLAFGWIVALVVTLT